MPVLYGHIEIPFESNEIWSSEWQMPVLFSYKTFFNGIWSKCHCASWRLKLQPSTFTRYIAVVLLPSSLIFFRAIFFVPNILLLFYDYKWQCKRTVAVASFEDGLHCAFEHRCWRGKNSSWCDLVKMVAVAVMMCCYAGHSKQKKLHIG